MIFKINVEKAYNHVNWNFLEKVLDKKGFRYKWRMQIWGCLRNMSYSFLINGSPRGRVVALRGLRQGDPVSCFLFLLVVDVLSIIFIKWLMLIFLSNLRWERMGWLFSTFNLLMI